jgi:hypothetical protein
MEKFFFHPYTSFFFLFSPYIFCNFNFGLRVYFLHILISEFKIGERKSLEKGEKREHCRFLHFSAIKLAILVVMKIHSKGSLMVVSFSYKGLLSVFG